MGIGMRKAAFIANHGKVLSRLTEESVFSCGQVCCSTRVKQQFHIGEMACSPK